MATCPQCRQNNDYSADGLCVKCYGRLHAERKLAADWLLHYDERRQQVEDMLAAYATLGATKTDGLPHGTDVGDPTQQKAIKLSEIKKRQGWIKVCEDIMRLLEPSKQRFVQWRIDAESACTSTGGRPGWTDYVEGQYAKEGEYPPDRKTMFVWWNEVVFMTIRFAVIYKCL